MVAHDPQSFLEALTKLFEATRDKGSVVVTFKRGKIRDLTLMMIACTASLMSQVDLGCILVYP